MYFPSWPSRKTTWSQPWADGLLLRDQGAGVVAAGLGRTHAAAAGAGVLLGEPQRHRLHAALEVGAGRARDHHEGDVLGRAHAEERLGGEHERPDVEALLPRRVRAPSAGRPSTRASTAWTKSSTVEHGQREAVARAHHPRGVLLGTEGPDRAVLVAVGLHPLEGLLRVVQDGGRGVEAERAVGLDPGVVPALVGRPLDQEHVVGEVVAEAGVREDLGEALVGDGRARAGGADLHG